MSQNTNEIEGSHPVDKLYERAMTFAKNKTSKEGSSAGISNLYVLQKIDKDGNVTHYDSRIEASKITGINDTNISKALSENFSNNKTAGGMLWFYDDGNIEQMVKENGIKAKTNKKAIRSIDSDGNINHYESVSEAKRKTGINNIMRSIKNGTVAGGMLWFYDE